MVRNDLFIAVPTFFKCPISLDVMKSPVSLCTGVTYDRSSIQAWLDNGNNTCPATMQVLDSKDFVPNHTLHRLIQIWSNSTSSSSTLSHQQARDLVRTIISKNCLDSMLKISEFTKMGTENCKFVGEMEGLVPVLVGLLNNADADLDLNKVEVAIVILDRILESYKGKEELMRSMGRNREVLASLVLVLKKGSLDSMMGTVRVLESIASDPESKIVVGETEGVLKELVRVISLGDESAISAGLSCLISVSVTRRIKVRVVQLGGVQAVGKLLSRYETVTIVEKSLKLLELMSTCTEGRSGMCEDATFVGDIVKKMLKVSKVATEHGAVILWSVCYLFRDQRAQDAVVRSNGLTKILLLMQSDCSQSVRHMCSDLMKIFRVNSKSCLSSYDTKTTHIMPF